MIKVINIPSPHIFTIFFLFEGVVIIFTIYPLRKFQIYDTVLFAISKCCSLELTLA